MTAATPLLVPMPLQVLLVNSLVQNDPTHQFERWDVVYESLNQFLDPVPAPFTNIQQQPISLGVHLHWKLPSALTHGKGESTEQVQFYMTPNRWIVVRLATTAGATTAPSMTAWIVQSDYLDPENGSSAFADPFTSTTGNVNPTKLGRNVKIEQWQGEPGGPMFLSPTGLADVTFTAFQPGVMDVFSFSDDTTALPENTLLTYMVGGWYSDPTKDPLATVTPASLDWNVLGTPSAAPSLTIVHGLIYGVQWQTTAIPPRIDADASQMQVAVGYTAVDALAAIVATQAGQGGGELETKLEAFQYDVLPTLDAPDGMAQLELLIRRAWFGSTPGGTRWKIVAVSQGQTTTEGLGPTTSPPQPPLTDAQAQWLADLNVAQRAYDTANRELMTMQWELFALWWKSQRIPFVIQNELAQQQGWGIDPTVIQTWINQALDTTNDASVVNAVLAAQTAVNTQANNLPDPTSASSIADWSVKIPPATKSQRPLQNPIQLALRPVALPAFFHPVDPVLLVAGLTPPTNDVDDSVALPCRTIDAAVTGVNVGTTAVTRGSGSLGNIVQIPATAALPAPVSAAVTALAIEAFFADPTNATSIAVNGAGTSDAGTIQTLATAMAAGTAQIATIPQPLQASFAFVPWQQAWAPLFLQWQISWFPTVAATPDGPEEPSSTGQYPAGSGGAQDNWPFLSAPWQFDGSDDVTARGSEYYTWTGGDPWSGGGPTNASYIGRTFLTPQATFLLIRRLADYVKLHRDDPDLDKIEALIDAVGETRFLSQSLSGFNAGFIMRGLTHSSAPPANSPVANAVAGENRGVPMVEVADQDFDFGSGTPFFFPVRGGFFQFERLQIVDAFGQVLDLLAANGNSVDTPANFFPIRGAGLVPDGNSGIATPARRVKQAPRIVQPSRLDLRLLDANDDTQEIYYSPNTNPVCGWLLPNHLDRSIAAYDASGNPLGELLVLANESGAQTVEWLAAPDVANPITDPSQIANAHLAAMLSAFTTSTGGIPAAGRVAAFKALYQSIDETLWMVDPPGGQGDNDLAVLIGRPLAVVRAQVQFELFGQPATNQSWRDTLQNLNADLTTYEFQIRLGSTELLNDGLIGYFLGDTYTTFDAVHPSTAATSPYVAPIAPGNYLVLSFDYPGYTWQTLTMLLDPRASVFATTGILPAATIQLPAEFYTDALAHMAVTFRSGPAVTLPSTIRLPFPAERHGAWSWVRRTGTGGTDWEIDPIVAADAKARLADAPPHLIDGWLKFTPENGT